MKSFFAVPALVAGALIVAGCTPGGTIAIGAGVGAAAPAVAAGFQGSANYQCLGGLNILTVNGTGATIVAYSSGAMSPGATPVNYTFSGGPLRYQATTELDLIIFEPGYGSLTYAYPFFQTTCTRI